MRAQTLTCEQGASPLRGHAAGVICYCANRVPRRAMLAAAASLGCGFADMCVSRRALSDTNARVGCCGHRVRELYCAGEAHTALL